MISFFFLKKTAFWQTSVHSQSLVKILWRSDKDKNTFKAIEKHRYGLRKTVSKHLNKRTDFMLSTAYSCFCSLTINKLHQERILRYREGNAQSNPWGHVNFTKVIFRPIKPVKLTWSLFPKRSANFYSVLHIHWREFNSRRSRVIGSWSDSRHQNILNCSVCFEAVVRGLDDVFTNRLKCAHVSGMRPLRPFTSESYFSDIYLFRQTP